jgi:deoxyribodipyrimidine photo-lyase
MVLEFATDYATIRALPNRIDPVRYATTRNYIDGGVTYTSPYISRGVISTKQVLEQVLRQGYTLPQLESLAKELCWRDYFQRVAQVKDVNRDLKQQQQPVAHHQLPIAVAAGQTGIEALDRAIAELYSSGYMHNHLRMYTASVVCNIAQSHWLHPAQWMYYHLLDGDWASNACSWQWVAGANSGKKYIANQENINRYTLSNQTGTFLDQPYEHIAVMETPLHLRETGSQLLPVTLPQATLSEVNPHLPAFIYNYYNLDPEWHADEDGHRILLLEPDFFNAYPMSARCMEFMLALGRNIPGLQVYVGSFASLCRQYGFTRVHYKEHPLNVGYTGIEEPRDWMVDNVTGYYPSFFAYWKKAEKELKRLYS